jgi:isopentenyldiphosphate isomerase
VYQIRGPQKSWAPGKLDVTVGGHYQAGETMLDGLREVEEELGKKYQNDQLTYLGRKPYVGRDTKGREMHNIIEVYMATDNSDLGSYVLQQEEVYAICLCPIDELIKAHSDPAYSFTTEALTSSGKTEQIVVRSSSFPENYDNYHFKIALLAKRYLDGDKHLIY